MENFSTFDFDWDKVHDFSNKLKPDKWLEYKLFILDELDKLSSVERRHLKNINRARDRIRGPRRVRDLATPESLGIEFRTNFRKSQKENLKTELFIHSDDYRTINLKDKLYRPTAKQAEVIQILHEAYKNRAPVLGQAFILEKIGSTSKRLRDTFKSRPEIWKNVIAQGESKGTYRLNIQ